MRTVLKAKKETPDATPLPCKIKAEAVFEGQEARAERCSQPEKAIVAHFLLAQDLRAAGGAHVPWEGPSMRNHFLRYDLINHGEVRGEMEGNTPAVFVKGAGTNQHLINPPTKKLSAGYGQGQPSPRVWWREGCPSTAPDWHALHAAYHFGITYTESSRLVLNSSIFSHHPKWRKRRRNSDKANNIHPRHHLSYPCKLPKDASNTSCMGTTQTSSQSNHNSGLFTCYLHV